MAAHLLNPSCTALLDLPEWRSGVWTRQTAFGDEGERGFRRRSGFESLSQGGAITAGFALGSKGIGSFLALSFLPFFSRIYCYYFLFLFSSHLDSPPHLTPKGEGWVPRRSK